jgi:hypothetical protein
LLSTQQRNTTYIAQPGINRRLAVEPLILRGYRIISVQPNYRGCNGAAVTNPVDAQPAAWRELTRANRRDWAGVLSPSIRLALKGALRPGYIQIRMTDLGAAPEIYRTCRSATPGPE